MLSLENGIKLREMEFRGRILIYNKKYLFYPFQTRTRQNVNFPKRL